MFNSSDYQKCSRLGHHRSIQTKPLCGNGRSRKRLVQPPGSNTRVFVDFFYDLRPIGRGKLVDVCPAGSHFGQTEAPKKRRWEKDGPHCCRGCAGGQ